MPTKPTSGLVMASTSKATIMNKSPRTCAPKARQLYSIPRVAKRLRISQKDAILMFTKEPGVVRGKRLPLLRIPKDVFARVHQRIDDFVVIVEFFSTRQLRRWWRLERRTSIRMLEWVNFEWLVEGELTKSTDHYQCAAQKRDALPDSQRPRREQRRGV
jgi:hypothetical protein